MSTAAATAFVGASVLLAVTPGPGVAYIVTRTLAQGRAAGLASVAGVAAGNLGSAIGTALGLAALLEASRTAYLVVSWAGAAYLVVLGWRMLRAARPQRGAAPPATASFPLSLGRLWREAFVVALFNPKTALFYAAFLPPFVDASRPVAPQTIALGAAFVGIAALSDVAYALAAGRIARGVPERAARRVQAVAGCGLILLGIAGGWMGHRRAA